MKARTSRHRQRGAALMVIASLLILGVAWGVVAALSRSSVSSNDREILTGQALHSAKQALLAYVAQYAGRDDHDFPGRMPCPESLNAIGGASEGTASGACSNTAVVTGRLPWKTLGIDQLRDGDGEPLWYVLSPNFHPVSFPLNAAPPDPYLNFNTPAQLPFEGANVVALIIAPGKGLHTISDPATPPVGCAKVEQTVSRYTSPLDATKFFECGNATGAYASLGTSQWTNDRAIAITQAEWVSAIAGPVAERLQRQVAPVLAGWDQFQQAAAGKSWGTTWGLAYLPFASTFGDPATDDYCGNAATYEGLIPLALTSPALCDTRWTGVSAAPGGLFPLGCTRQPTYLSCSFLRLFGALLPVNITATATNVGYGYRGTIHCPMPYNATTCDINLPGGGTVNSMNMNLSAAGTATATLQVSFPPLPLFATAEVRIPYLPDAQFLTNNLDPSGAFQATQWFRENNWHRFTYYAVARSALPVSATPCNAQGDAGCLEVRGFPVSTEPATGPYWKKRLVLVLAGPALAGQNRAGAPGDPAQYFEEHNASTGDRIYRADLRLANPSAATPPYVAFNDRVATCPFQYTPDTGGPVPICN